MTAIEGGTAEHRRILSEIISGLGQTEIGSVQLEERAALFESDWTPTPEQIRDGTGLALRLVSPDDPSARAEWEMELVAVALRQRLAREDLEQVVWLQLRSSGGTLQWTESPAEPLTASEQEQVGGEIRAAAVAYGVRVVSFDLLQPLGHAWAVTLYTEEPHSFLRLQFREFASAVDPWRKRCGRQTYIEIRDHHDDRVLLLATTFKGGRSSVRRDLTCCDPLVHISRPMFEPPPPRCPVFD